jgi:hypothetical protein
MGKTDKIHRRVPPYWAEQRILVLVGSHGGYASSRLRQADLLVPNFLRVSEGGRLSSPGAQPAIVGRSAFSMK